jgi:hypothetical protein
LPGYDRGNSDPRATEWQRVEDGARYGADRQVLDVVTFAVPVTIGQAFDWGVFATLTAGASSYGASLARSTAWADFSQSVSLAGSAGLCIGNQAQQPPLRQARCCRALASTANRPSAIKPQVCGSGTALTLNCTLSK